MKTTKKIPPLIFPLLWLSAAACQASEAEDSFQAALTQVKGQVLFQPSQKSGWIKARKPMGLKTGDRIKVEKASLAEMTINGESLLYLEENTEGEIQELAEAKHSFKLSNGLALASVKKLKGTKFEIRTPVAVASVRGTDLGVEASTDTAQVAVFDGRVVVMDFARDSGLPMDGTNLLVHFLHEVDVSSNQVATATRKGVKTPTGIDETWKTRKELLNKRKAGADSLGDNYWRRQKTFKDVRDELLQDHPENTNPQ